MCRKQKNQFSALDSLFSFFYANGVNFAYEQKKNRISFSYMNNIYLNPLLNKNFKNIMFQFYVF